MNNMISPYKLTSNIIDLSLVDEKCKNDKGLFCYNDSLKISRNYGVSLFVCELFYNKDELLLNEINITKYRKYKWFIISGPRPDSENVYRYSDYDYGIDMIYLNHSKRCDVIELIKQNSPEYFEWLLFNPEWLK